MHDGDNLASVTRSGGPRLVAKQVETRPGHTKLELRSGNSRSVIVQSSDPADLPLDKIPPAFRDLLRQ